MTKKSIELFTELSYDQTFQLVKETARMLEAKGTFDKNEGTVSITMYFGMQTVPVHILTEEQDSTCIVTIQGESDDVFGTGAKKCINKFKDKFELILRDSTDQDFVPDFVPEYKFNEQNHSVHSTKIKEEPRQKKKSKRTINYKVWLIIGLLALAGRFLLNRESDSNDNWRDKYSSINDIQGLQRALDGVWWTSCRAGSSTHYCTGEGWTEKFVFSNEGTTLKKYRQKGNGPWVFKGTATVKHKATRDWHNGFVTQEFEYDFHDGSFGSITAQKRSKFEAVEFKKGPWDLFRGEPED